MEKFPDSSRSCHSFKALSSRATAAGQGSKQLEVAIGLSHHVLPLAKQVKKAQVSFESTKMLSEAKNNKDVFEVG